MNFPVEEIKTDVLVIGGGAAGMMAAIGAYRAGVDVLLVTKSTFPAGSSSMARSGYATAFGHEDPRDNPDVHFEDTIRGGYGINNQKLVRIMVEQLPAVTREVDSWGLGLVKKTEDLYHQKLVPGDTYPRFVHCVGMINRPLMRTLSGMVKKLNIPVVPFAFIVDLLVEDGEARGAWGFLVKEGKLLVITAKSVVLATGGAPQLHEVNDSPPFMTGDGYAMALRAGADLIDMEMIDYQLLTCAPPKLRGYPPATTSFIAHGAYLLNAHGERFMARYDPVRMEKVNRALINRAVGLEIFEGRGTENGGIYVDARHIYDEMLEVSGEVIRAFKNAGVDLRESFMEVCSGPHTYLGGVRVDTESRSTVPGLFAGGEATGGVHGANRLSGAALADSLTFGLRSGQFAAAWAKSMNVHPSIKKSRQALVDEINSYAGRDGDVSVDEFRLMIQKEVVTNLGQVRSGERLRKGLEAMASLRNEVPPRLRIKDSDPRQLLDNVRKAMESLNLIRVAECLGVSALTREESRGGHFRIDFPEQDDANWLVNVVVRLSDTGEVVPEVVPVVTE